MDSKQVKSILKEASDAIKNKEIEKALKLCKAVLKADHKNYAALVLFGAALQESESKSDALVAFKKATEISPDQILAWQGLASYYEKEGPDKFTVELLSIYKKLLLLERENVKWEKTVQKLNNVIQYVPISESIEMFEVFLEYKNELRLLLTDVLYNYFSNLKSVPECYLYYFRKVLLIKIENDTTSTDYVRKYLDVLLQQKEYQQFFKEFKNLLSMNDLDIYDLELLCKAYTESSTVNYNVNTFDNIGEYCDLLLQKKENSFVGQLTKAIILYDSGDYASCRDILNEVLVCDSDNENWLVHYYLSKVYRILYCFNEAVINLLSTRKCFTPDISRNVEENIEKWTLECLAKSENVDYCEDCFQRCTQILSSDSTNEYVIKCLIRAGIFLKKWESVESNLIILEHNWNPNLEDIILKALYHYNFGEEDQAISLLKNGIREELDFVDYYLLLGKIYWERRNYTDSVNCFLTVSNLAPHIYISFLYLGHFYCNIDLDLDKAKICYQKAFQLNRNSDEIAIALSDTYGRLGSTENNVELLTSITSMSDKKWAWLKLGQLHLDNGNLALAVNCLRFTVRKYPEDSHCWEVLGDVYIARGSYVSALKSFQKSLEFNPSSCYASLQIATVTQRIGLFDESIEKFRVLVEENPQFVPALKGLSEACLMQARELFEKQLLGSVKDLCQEAVVALTSALELNNGFSCIWKLLADVCILVCQLPKKISYLTLPSWLLEKKYEIEEYESSLTVHTDRLLEFSVRCYLAAIYLSGKDKNILSFLWHDVAFCYNLQATFVDATEKERLRSLAFVAAEKSTKLNPDRWQHWNLLGVIASSEGINDGSFAQNCFLRAIQIEKNNPVSWNNLGCLYLQHEAVQPANEAFRNAQRIDPKYARAWTGQAIIAESVDDVETADLFYHSVTLSYHEESSKGFANWICKILKNWDKYKNNYLCYYLIKKMSGPQIAIDILTWYTVHYPEDSWAMNTLSVLFELCNLNRSAVSSSKIALQLAPNQYIDIVRSNLGRQLRKIEEYKNAIQVYKQIKTIDFPVQCDFALTTYLDGQYDVAFHLYESAIQRFAPDDESVAEVKVATAALNYLRNMKEEAKTTLFECINLKPVPIYGLFAACAFGMLNSQLKLSKLVLKELESFKHLKEHILHIALFNTYCEVFQGNFKKAIRTMSKFLYSNPGNAELWLSLCLLLINLIYSSQDEYLEYSPITAYHAKCAIILGKGVMDVSKIYSIVSLSYLVAGKAEESLKSSMKAVFIYPNVAENWAVLIATQYSRGKNYPSLIRTIQYVRDHLNCSKPLKSWLTSVERKVTAITGTPVSQSDETT